jgi:glycosyltransferase involved in cell wall biosynthesis
METVRTKLVIVAPVYSSTIYGAAYGAQLLLESQFSRVFDITHINTRFVDSVAELERPSARKAVLFARYFVLLWSAVRRENPAYVVICPAFSTGAFVKDSLYTMFCARILQRKVIWWTHAGGLRALSQRTGRFGRFLMRRVINAVHRIVTVGSHQRDEFCEFSSPSKVDTIHYGVPPRDFYPDRFDDRRDIRVLYFANLEKTKGWLMLLNSAKKVCEIREDVSFDFYGNPGGDSPLETINEAFATTGFTERIVYHGPAYGEEKYLAFASADIFCFPSTFRHEALPLVTLEATNAGLPIISTRHASIPDVVIDGLGGILIGTNELDTLHLAILRLADQRALRRLMGAYNQRRYYECFTTDVFVNNWINFIKRIGAESM